METTLIHARYVGNTGVPPDCFAAIREALVREKAKIQAGNSEQRTKLAQLARSLRARARTNGLRAGMQAALVALSQNLKTEKELYDRALAHAERDCLELVLAIAREVIGTDLAVHPGSLSTRIVRGLSELKASVAPSVRVSPADFEVVAARLMEQRLEIDCSPDPELDMGDAVLCGASGRLEISWRAHFDEVAERMRSLIRPGRS